jgi:hypothetical protein
VCISPTKDVQVDAAKAQLSRAEIARAKRKLMKGKINAVR